MRRLSSPGIRPNCPNLQLLATNYDAGVFLSTTALTVEEGDSGTFAIALPTAPTGDVDITISPDLSSDAIISSNDPDFPGANTIRFTTSNWFTPQVITVDGIDDGIVEGDETTTLTLDISSTDAAYDALASQSIDVTIQDAPGIFAELDQSSFAEDGTATLSVRLGAVPTGSVVVQISSDDTGEATVSPAELTFTNSADVQVVTISGVDDSLLDGNQAITLTVAVDPVQTTDATYTTLDAITLDATVQDIENQLPLAVVDQVTTLEDTAVTIDVLANDSDADGETLSVVDATSLNGSAVINADNTITFTPEADFNGSAIINYTITDGNDTADSGVLVTVTEVNDAPLTVDQFAATEEETEVLVNVIGNSFDVDGDALTVTVTNTVNGTATVTSDGQVAFTPSADIINATLTVVGDSDVYTLNSDPISVGFDYTISDGRGGTDSGTVFVGVVAINDAPIVGADSVATDSSLTVDEDSLLTFADTVLLANDTDVDLPTGETLILVDVDDTASKGVVSLSDDGIISYDPRTIDSGSVTTATTDTGNAETPFTEKTEFFDALDDGESATDTFTYTIEDDLGEQATGTATITVTGVNDAPVAEDDYFQNSGNGLFNILLPNPNRNVLSNDVDVDTNDTLTVIPQAFTTQQLDSDGNPIPGTTVANGAILGDGTFFYIYNGAPLGVGEVYFDTFQYEVTDGTVTTTATATVMNTGPQVPGFAVSERSLEVQEGAVIDEFVVALTAAPDSDVVLNISNSSPQDLVTDVTQVTFTPENWFTPQVVQVAAVEDFEAENTESATLSVTFDQDSSDSDYVQAATLASFFSPSFFGGGLFNSGLFNSDFFNLDFFNSSFSKQIAVTIEDKEPVPEIIASDLFIVLDEDGPAGSFTVSLGQEPTSTVVVNVASDDEDVATVSSSTLTFGPGDFENKTVVVNPIDNDDVEFTGFADISLTVDPDQSDDVYDDVDPEFVLAIVQEDDTFSFPTTSLVLSFDVDGISENGGSATGTILRVSDDITEALTVALDAGDTTDITLPDSVVIPAGEESVTFTVTGVDDNELEPPETIIIEPSASGALGGAASLIVFDDDTTLSVSIDPISIAENGGTATGTVTRTTTNGPLVVSLSSSDTSEATVLDSVTIAAGETSADFTITAVDDNLADGIQSVTITASATNFGYTDGTADLSVTDDDGGSNNTAPDAVDDAFTTDEDTLLSDDVLTNDSDIDGDGLTVSAVQGATAFVGSPLELASGAILTMNSDGTFDYDPNGQFEDLNSGETNTDTFTYTVTDGTESRTATATVTIDGAADTATNTAPVAEDDAISTDEDRDVITVNGLFNNVLSNDSDADGHTLTVVSIDDTGTTGLVTLTNGVIVYDPNGQFESLDEGQSATDTFSYTIDDGNGGTDTATVTVTIDGVDDPDNAAPDAVDDAASTDEYTAIDITNALANDSDVDGDNVSVLSINTSRTAGLVTDNGDGTFSYDPNGQFISLNDGETATDSFTYTIDDGNDGVDTATVNISITGVTNSEPVALSDAVATDEDTAIASVDVLTNDVDADGNTLSVLSVDGSNTTGQVTLNADGTISYDPNGQFEDLNNGDAASDSFSYTVSDGNGGTSTTTVGIVISGVTDGGANTTPEAEDDTVNTGKDIAISDVGVLTNDFDVDGDTVSVISVDDTNTAGLVTLTNGVISYDPNGAFSDLEAFDFDPSAAVDTDADTLTLINHGLTQGDEVLYFTDGTAINGLTSGKSYFVIVQDANTIQLAPDSGTSFAINFTGTGTGTTSLSTLGTDTFTYTISDSNEGTDIATVTISLNGANVTLDDDGTTNTAPVAIDDAVSTDEATALSAIAVLTNDTDADADGLTVTGVDDSATTGLVTNNGDGTFSYDPNGQFEALNDGDTATDSFNYTISDGTATDTATVTVTINGVDEPVLNTSPVASNDTVSTNEDTALSSIAVLNNDTDADNDPLTVTGVDDSATTGLVTDNGDGTFSYDPNGQFEALNDGDTATDSFTYTISDGNGGTDTATVTVTIDGVDDSTTPTEEALLLSLNSTVNLNGVAITPQDIALFDGTDFSLFFDGSDVGLTSGKVNAFDAISDTEILLSFDNPITLPGIGSVDDSDVVLFTATSLGESTAGSFAVYFDGSDVGLSNGGEDIDGLQALPDGNLLISVNGNLKPGSSTIATDEDVVLFSFTSTGENTAGTFSQFLDGSDIGLASEDVDGFAIDAAGEAFFSLTDDFTAGGVAGADEDVIGFTATTTGETTSGSFASELFFDGSANGLQFRDVQGIGFTGTHSGTVESLSLSLDPDSISENGGIATATVTRTGDLSTDLTVTLSSSDTSEVVVTDSVVIAAGESSIEVLINGVDDDVLDGPQTATITAAATGFTSDTATLEVTDDEVVPGVLNVGLDTGSISENGGVTLATLTRTGDLSTDLTVSLSSSDTTEAVVSSPVVIPMGQESTTFVINAVDDSDVDGPQAVTITASATGLTSGSASLNITDDEVANTAPEAVDDAVSTDEDTALSAIAVLSNDSDIDGDNLTIVDVDTTGTLGLVVNNGDGTFAYAPNSQFEGLNAGETATDSFSYTVSDGNSGTDTATVNVSITGVDDNISIGLEIGLYDAATDELIQSLQDGDMIDSSLLPNQDNLTIAAFVLDSDPFANQVESIRLNLNNGQKIQTESFEPYALFGDIDSNYRGGEIPLGSNTVDFEIYSQNGANGQLLDTITLNFTVV